MLTSSTSRSADSSQIVVDLDDVNQLFTALDLHPFSTSEIDLLGESAMDRIIRKMLSNRLRSRDVARMTVELPADQISATTESEVSAAVKRFCKARIEDNELTISTSIRQALTLLIIVIVVVAAIGAVLAFLFWNGRLSTSEPIGILVAFSYSVLAWVTLWDPVESLAFDWNPGYRENRVLRHLSEMEVVVQPRADSPLPSL
jgi:hypothetical protein